jgi:hypothetical protein
MSNVTLSMLLTARDDASGVFRRVGTAAGGVDKAHGRLARSAAVAKTAMAGLGIAAAGAAVYFAKDSVQAYAAAEKAQLALQDAYKKYPSLANANINALRSLNTQLQAKTRFDDDDLAMMQSRLAAFKLTGQQLREITPLVADYAAKTGKDIVTAGGSVGKALLGNTRALKELGINYTSTGNRAKDYTNIVGLLQKKVGGFATGPDAKTAEATLARLDHAFGEIQETVGRALLPYLTDLANWLTSNMPAIQSAVEDAMPGVRRAFTLVGEAAQDVGGFLKGAWDAFDSMPEGVKKAAIDITAVAVALGALKATGVTGGIKLAFDMGKGLFSAVKGMNVNAGVVNVNGKVGGGVPGKGGGGFPGAGAGGLGALASSLGLIVGGVAIPAIVAKIGNDLSDKFPWLNNNTRGQRGGVTGGSTDNPVPGRFGRSNTPGAGSKTSWGKEAQEAKRAQEAIDAANAAVSRSVSAFRGAARSQKDYKQALSNSTKIAKQNEAGIKGHTQAATRNRMALFQQAAAGQGVLANMKKMGASSTAVTRTQRQLGAQFVKVAKDMGVPKGQARDLARAYGLLPPKKTTKVDAPGATKSKKDIDAHNKSAKGMPNKKSTKVDAPGADRSKSLIDRVTSAARSLEGTYTANLQTSGADAAASDAYRAAQAAGSFAGDYIANLITRHTTESSGGGPATHPGRRGNGPRQATGGQIRGPGTSTSDSIAAWLSNGEFVIRTQSAKAIGYDRLRYMNVTGQMPAFGSGGPVNIGSKQVRADDDRDYAAAEKEEINRAIAAGDKERADDIRKRRRRKGESQKSYDRRIRGMDNFRERVDAARSAKAQAQAIVDRRKARAAEKKAAADEKRRAFADAIREHNDSARGVYDQFASEATGGVRAGLDSIKGFASVTGFDLSASAQAQEELAMARASVNGAGSADERRNALEAVKAAQLKVNATAANGTNVTAWMNKKLNIVKGFKKALDNLKSRGLNATTLSEVAQMDPESGTQIANALAGSNLTQINSLQDQILTEGGSYGKLVHNAGMDADAQASKVVANIVQGGGVKTTVNVNSKLFLDGQELYKSLLRVERQTGKQLFVTRSR